MLALAGCRFDQGGLPYPDGPDGGAVGPADDPADDPAMDPGMAPPEDPCANGVCECPLPLEDCGGSCKDITSDDRHCGGCDVRCRRDESCYEAHCYRSSERNKCDDCGDGDVCRPRADGKVDCIEVGGD